MATLEELEERVQRLERGETGPQQCVPSMLRRIERLEQKRLMVLERMLDDALAMPVKTFIFGKEQG